MSIYLVLKNFKDAVSEGVSAHENGIVKAGTYLTAEAEDSRATRLAGEGLIRLVEGASTIEEAEVIVAQEVEDAKPKLNVKGDAAPGAGDTWGAKKDPVVAPAAPAGDTIEEKPVDTTTPVAPAPGSNTPIVGSGDVAPGNDAGANL